MLWKRVMHGLVKPWHERMFHLRFGASGAPPTLRWCDAKHDGKHESKISLVASLAIKAEHDHGRARTHCFRVKGADTHLLLSARTEDDKLRWMRALARAIAPREPAAAAAAGSPTSSGSREKGGQHDKAGKASGKNAVRSSKIPLGSGWFEITGLVGQPAPPTAAPCTLLPRLVRCPRAL